MVNGELLPAFVIRYRGAVYGYLNQCAHQSVELDWNEGEFFDKNREFLICAIHGARYDPKNGSCIDGRCAGRGLQTIDVEEINAKVCLKPKDGVHLV